MKKKLLATLLSLTVICSFVPASAAEVEVQEQSIVFEVVDCTSITDGGLSRDVSWGTASLKASNPLFSKPQAYAVSETYSGNAYKITAKVSVTDDNSNTYDSGTRTESNSSKATSGTIVSKTSGCTFNGTHSIQDTSSSGWKYGSTSKTY